jgi:dTDP-4-amino-4,6-dideoxygalactose transaminase
MSEFNAAFGLLQLKYIDQALARRKEIDAVYRALLSNIKGIQCIDKMSNVDMNYSYFPILVNHEFKVSRDEIYQKLKDNNIYARRYFYPLISDFPMYRNMLSARRQNLKNAVDISSEVICLPMHHAINHESQTKIVNIIRENSFGN